MPPALRTLPKLLGGPWIVWSGVSKLHLVATALATNLDLDVMHARILQGRGRLG